VADTIEKVAHGEGWEHKEREDRYHAPAWIKNGHMIVVEDPSVTEEHIRPLFKLADRLAADNPLPHGQKLNLHIITRSEMDALFPDKKQGWTRGYNFAGTGNMSIAGDSIKDGVLHEGGWNAPVADHVPHGQYTFVHEWGHGLDERSDAARLKDRLTHPAKTSEYGATNEFERYAESFTEFYLSDGKTLLLSPRQDAEKYGWKVTPE
jgi:hypothetical protein